VFVLKSFICICLHRSLDKAVLDLILDLNLIKLNLLLTYIPYIQLIFIQRTGYRNIFNLTKMYF